MPCRWDDIDAAIGDFSASVSDGDYSVLTSGLLEQLSRDDLLDLLEATPANSSHFDLEQPLTKLLNFTYTMIMPVMQEAREATRP